MAGPWERYRKQPETEPAVGPWSRFGAQPPAQDEQVSVASDMAQSGLSGLRQGIESAIGGFGDVGKYQGQIAEWAAEKLGASPETAATVAGVASKLTAMPFAKTTDEIRAVTAPALGQAYEPQTTAGEYSRTVGEFAPAILGGKGSLVKRGLTQVLLPALGSEAAGQLTEGSKYELYARIAGALAGGVLPSAAKRLVSPLPISPERQAMVDALAREGIDLTAGQSSGRSALKYAESELGGGRAAQLMENQGEQFTSAALKRAGIEAKRATPDVMDEAFTRIGSKFDDLAANTKVPLDTQLQDDMLKVVTDYQGAVGTPAPALERLMNRAAELAGKNGVLEGEAYKNLRSDMGGLSKMADGPTKQALRGLQEALDDAVERHMPQQFMDDWQNVRREYRNILVLEKAATAAGESAAQGIISPSSLRNATVQQSRRGYARGQGDFAELARSGEGVMKPLPNSGTAPRLSVRSLGASIPGVLGAAAGAQFGGAPGAVAGLLAGSALPFAAGRALLSAPVRSYLGNQMASGLPTSDPKIAAIVAALLSRREQAALPAPSN